MGVHVLITPPGFAAEAAARADGLPGGLEERLEHRAVWSTSTTSARRWTRGRSKPGATWSFNPNAQLSIVYHSAVRRALPRPAAGAGRRPVLIEVRGRLHRFSTRVSGRVHVRDRRRFRGGHVGPVQPFVCQLTATGRCGSEGEGLGYVPGHRRTRSRTEEERLIMRRMLKFPLLLALLAVGLLSAAGSAGAAQTTSQIVLGAGSDTTYYMMGQLDNLYNQSPGCNNLASTQPLDGSCVSGSPADAENFFHNTAAERYFIGSGGGINQLCKHGLANVAQRRVRALVPCSAPGIRRARLHGPPLRRLRTRRRSRGSASRRRPSGCSSTDHGLQQLTTTQLKNDLRELHRHQLEPDRRHGQVRSTPTSRRPTPAPA